MRVKIARWGNSTAVRIPQAIVDGLKLKAGEEMEMRLRDSAVEFVRPNQAGHMTLDEMCAEMERLGIENAPETLEWGSPRGSEIIEDDDYSLGIITPETMERDWLARNAK